MPTRGKSEDIAEKAGQVIGGGTGDAVLVHVGTNNAEKEGTSAIVGKYRRLIKTLKGARVGQIVLSGILPIMGGRGEEYKNCRRMAINTQVLKVCMEEGVGFVDMWLKVVGRDDFFIIIIIMLFLFTLKSFLYHLSACYNVKDI